MSCIVSFGRYLAGIHRLFCYVPRVICVHHVTDGLLFYDKVHVVRLKPCLFSRNTRLILSNRSMYHTVWHCRHFHHITASLESHQAITTRLQRPAREGADFWQRQHFMSCAVRRVFPPGSDPRQYGGLHSQ